MSERRKSTWRSLEKRKKGILWAIQQDPEDEDAQKAFRDLKRDISEAKIRLATLKTEAQPFGSNDALTIAYAIAHRFDGWESWTVEQKRGALAEVVEKIRINGNNEALLTVRGGLPLQRLNGVPAIWLDEIQARITTKGFGCTKVVEKRLAAIYKELEGRLLQVANLQSLSWKSFEVSVSLEGCFAPNTRLENRPVKKTA